MHATAWARASGRDRSRRGKGQTLGCVSRATAPGRRRLATTKKRLSSRRTTAGGPARPIGPCKTPPFGPALRARHVRGPMWAVQAPRPSPDSPASCYPRLTESPSARTGRSTGRADAGARPTGPAVHGRADTDGAARRLKAMRGRSLRQERETETVEKKKAASRKLFGLWAAQGRSTRSSSLFLTAHACARGVAPFPFPFSPPSERTCCSMPRPRREVAPA